MPLFTGFDNDADPGGGRDNAKFYGFDAKSISEDVNANTAARTMSGTRSALSALSAEDYSGAHYFCTDCDAVYKSDGSAWTKIRTGGFGGTFLADPPSSGLTTSSLGSAAFSASLDGRLLTCPTAAGDNWRIEYKSLSPTSNYTATAYLDPVSAPVANSWFTGIVLVETSSGKLIHFGPGSSSGFIAHASKWNSVTSFNAHYVASALSAVDSNREVPRWLRITDNGTNRVFEYSYNSTDWITAHTVGRTDFITPDAIGWGANNNCGSTVLLRCRSLNVA